MEVGDEDPGDLGAVEAACQTVLRVRQPDPRVDEGPAVVAREQVRVDVARTGRQRRS